jgi:hypothetical protein
MTQGTPTFEIFKGKDFSDLLKDIYKNSSTKDKVLNQLIGELRNYIKSSNDAAHILPLIRELIEVGVRNDDHLIKLAAICQRMIANQTKALTDTGSSYKLSEEEMAQLMEEVTDLQDAVADIKEDDVTVYRQKAQTIVDKLNTSEAVKEVYVSGEDIDKQLEDLLNS